MSTLIIVRHGQSVWNKENKFTGWVDVELSENGIAEAQQAGKLLKDCRFDQGFTSDLRRAQHTLEIILATTGQTDLPVTKDTALNERHYGDLAGLNKQATREKYGDDQVHIWRRSYDTPPPGGESLKDTAERVLPYYEGHIEPLLRDGKDILISAHGNSLRALIMRLEELSPEEITQTEIPTGKPKRYDFDDEMNILEAYFLE